MTARLHPSGHQRRPRSLSLPDESTEFQFSGKIDLVLNFGWRLLLRPSNQSHREEKVVGDAVGVLSGGGAPSSEPSGGERRDVRTLRVVRTSSLERLRESFEALTLGFTPATRSSIESLPKVRLDSLEQATMEQISTCSICKDEFAEGGVDRLISLLPCAHCLHADCISLWLERSHLCPLCHHALPTVEDGDSSNS
ncbi:hypothetical protein ACLB2K_013903 [Fragaria x ananassa]